MKKQIEREVITWLEDEYNHPFEGWDFSYRDNRRVALSTLLWNYETIASEYVEESRSLLDIETGGGEILSELLSESRFRGHAYAVEPYSPNISVARELLLNQNVEVIDISTTPADFSDGSFDLVLNRHGGSISPAEICRILETDGYFVTQQVGEKTNHEVRELFRVTRPVQADWPRNLPAAVRVFEGLGLVVEVQNECVYTYRFMDVGALVYYLKAVPWEVPNFSLSDNMALLIKLHLQSEERGFAIDASFHSYLMVARKL